MDTGTALLWLNSLSLGWHWEQSDPIYHIPTCLSHESSGKSWNDNPY